MEKPSASPRTVMNVEPFLESMCYDTNRLLLFIWMEMNIRPWFKTLRYLPARVQVTRYQIIWIWIELDWFDQSFMFQDFSFHPLNTALPNTIPLFLRWLQWLHRFGNVQAEGQGLWYYTQDTEWRIQKICCWWFVISSMRVSIDSSNVLWPIFLKWPDRFLSVSSIVYIMSSICNVLLFDCDYYLIDRSNNNIVTLNPMLRLTLSLCSRVFC